MEMGEEVVGWEKRLKEKPSISFGPSGRKQGTRGKGQGDKGQGTMESDQGTRGRAKGQEARDMRQRG